eukprot:1497832-Prymnesium_polylepis.1
MPTGHTASIRKPVARVASYSSQSHESARSARTGSDGMCPRHTGMSRTEGPEDSRRRARQHREGEAERRRQHPLQPGCEGGEGSCCKNALAPAATAPNDLSANKAGGAGECDGQRPR